MIRSARMVCGAKGIPNQRPVALMMEVSIRTGSTPAQVLVENEVGNSSYLSPKQTCPNTLVRFVIYANLSKFLQIIRKSEIFDLAQSETEDAT